MKKPHHPGIRLVLRDAPEGLTALELAARIPDMDYNAARRALNGMPDAYIDRWILMPGSRGQFQAVWCVVTPPDNCPHPKDRFKVEARTQWAHRHTTL
jgi:hypothetical protein